MPAFPDFKLNPWEGGSLQQPAPPRRLIVVRAGPGTVHKNWYSSDTHAEFDVAVSYYGDGEYIPQNGEFVHYFKGGKWEGIFDFFIKNPRFLSEYTHIWLPDDDIVTNTKEIHRLFKITEARALQLCQPSLSWESYYSHVITLQNRSFELRYTNFVELMAPLFTAEALKRVLPLFEGVRFGWGLDKIWSRLLLDPQFGSAIIDAVAVGHYRPILSGSLYKKGALTPLEEHEQILSRFSVDVSSFRPLVYGGLGVTSGKRLRGLWLRYKLYSGWKGLRACSFLAPPTRRKSRKVMINVWGCTQRMPELSPISIE
jgi:hypothetical protein